MKEQSEEDKVAGCILGVLLWLGAGIYFLGDMFMSRKKGDMWVDGWGRQLAEPPAILNWLGVGMGWKGLGWFLVNLAIAVVVIGCGSALLSRRPARWEGARLKSDVFVLGYKMPNSKSAFWGLPVLFLILVIVVELVFLFALLRHAF